jgi:ribosomal protein L11 methylase PrmA
MIIGAQWVPTSMDIVKSMLELAEVQEGDVVIDLGSGDGRIIITAAKDYNARAIGIEADPIRLIWSRSKIRKNGLSERVKVLWGNFLYKSLGEATVVTVYQNQETNNKLKPKFETELKPGTRVVSHVFIFDGWKPIKVDKESQIYLYLV